MIDWEKAYAARMERVLPSEIRELVKYMRQPDMISFGGGLPEPDLFPTQAIADAFAMILGDPARAKSALQYSDTAGYMPLREYIARYMSTLQVDCTAENIIITAGSQQAIDFIAKLFLSAGDTVLVEAPTYLGGLRAFDTYEARYALLPTPFANAADVQTADGAKPKLGYVMSDFKNPTGVSFTLAERNRMLDLADEMDIPLIEDNAYEKLRYSGTPVRSLLSLDAERVGGIENSRIIYTSTFSKVVAPSLRLGWVTASSAIIRKLELIKQAADLAPAHLERICATYRGRRDAMLAALAEHMPAGVTWSKPEGGLFIWVTLPAPMNAPALVKRALIDFKVGAISGKSCYGTAPEMNTLRLSFSMVPEARIAEGIRRLGAAIRAA
jgi:DNA-binding transcriptional MocR family regulator